MSGKIKNSEKDREEKKTTKKQKKSKKDKTQDAAESTFSLLANDQALNPTLSSLFAVKQPPVKPVVSVTSRATSRPDTSDADDDADEIPIHEAGKVTQDNVDASEIRRDRKRKRKDVDDDLEDAYMKRLAREEAKETERANAERLAKRSKSETERDGQDFEDGDSADENEGDGVSIEEESQSDIEMETDDDDDEAGLSPPPRHETETTADLELSKASRTVFLGNVSTEAISSKSGRKALLHHLASFFDKLATPKEGAGKHKVESIRFRSTPYASAIPKKAAFAKKELMDATAKSTNAYAVYSSIPLAREAVKHLNGSIVLERHLRVDQVAHPAKVDNRRCVFVGNLGFVDDESNILKADEEDGREKRKPGKEPADIEEGLWRTFGKCGAVESVRVIRDSTTRVGKGIAYVQFQDENGVEAALLYNDKKFPPMLPRKLRVSRAKAQKRNVKPGSDRPASKPSTLGYQRKVTAEEASKAGRAGKLLGRAGAARTRNHEREPGDDSNPKLGNGIQKPEDFIFEGHRASAKQGKSGLKLGGRGKKAKVTKRSASFRATNKKKT